MLPIIRTDRRIYLVHADDPAVAEINAIATNGKRSGWYEVEEPVADALTLKVRCVGGHEIIEVSTLARLQSDRAVREDYPGATETDRQTLERACFSAIIARRSIVGVLGPVPEDLRAVVAETPGAILPMLGTAATDLGTEMTRRSLLPDPFGHSAFGR